MNDTPLANDTYLVVNGIVTCHDCRHPQASHSRPDPEGMLGYGMGSCGNCTACIVWRLRCGCGPMTLTAAQEAKRLGTPRWAEQAFKAEALRSTLEYLVATYNQHVDAANRDKGTLHPMPKLFLVEDVPASLLPRA